jgi:hypothetical protein
LKRVIVAALLAAFAGSSGAAVSTQTRAPEPDTWAPLRFLLGTWDTTSSGQPGTGAGQRHYRLVLRDRFIEARNTVTYPPQPKNPKGETHEDAGYFSYDRSRKAIVFRQFHGEGFVNTYVASRVEPNEVAFTSEAIENIPSGWRARETFRVVSEAEVFELAEPGKEFTVYSETRMRRAAPRGPRP